MEHNKSNIIYIVGIGPGDEEMMTTQAISVLDSVDVIIGYTVYLDLLGERFANKRRLSTPMKQEIERCRLCFEEAKKGYRVAMICSGDAGVYGMAAPMYELLESYEGDMKLDIEVVPGVTAAISGAAVLGAPINHDFCIISLSDLLTPMELIEKRVRAAVEGDFVIVLYNPSSRKRQDYLKRMCDIMLEAGAALDRACGYVKNIGREGLEAKTMTLEVLRDTQVDMFTTVFIGNSKTYILGDKLVTRRGYIL
ncbi:MAG: precorrin-3B C(17)-methyltransferase [Lachnospiraceae bacterium]|nr:precorrin-3B C(17)-methyltransferase [Lachnospiraceae bacterium]